MRAPPNAAVRRFAAVWTLSVVLKLAALAVFALLVLKILGVF